MNRILKIQPITSGYRPIKNGSRYDRYFPSVSNTQREIVSDRSAEVEDVVEKMKSVVWKYKDDTKQLAPLLKGGSLKQTAENIWNFLYHHIQYKLDTSGIEELRRPARLWSDKHGDCDDFSMAASSILLNLGIPHAFRITKYDKLHFQHVYVVVPYGKGKYYIIDPVLSQANYEKPYTDKKDFNMSINGINVAVLEGFGSTNTDLISDLIMDDLSGLGSFSDRQADEKLYHHLLNTRKFVQENPKAVALYENPETFLQTLNYAIRYWNTPRRQEALQVLADNEEKYNRENGLSGFDEMDDDWDILNGLSDAEVVQYLQDLENPAIDGLGMLGRWGRKKKKTSKRFWSKVKEGAKKAGKAFVKYNPAVAAARAGFLLAMKLNMFKYAQRLKWGYASKQQIKGKISGNYWRKAKKTLVAVERLFADKLQGKRSNLKKAILSGRSGGLKGLGGNSSLGVVAESTLITAAGTVLGIVAHIFKKNKLNKEEKPTSAEAPAPIQERQYSSIGPTSQAESYEMPSVQPQGKLARFVKEKPVLAFAGGAGILGFAAWGISSLVKRNKGSKSSSSGMAGTGTKARKTRTRKARPKTLKIEKLK